MLAEIACLVNRLVSRYCSNTPQIQGKSPPLKKRQGRGTPKFQIRGWPPAGHKAVFQMRLNLSRFAIVLLSVLIPLCELRADDIKGIIPVAHIRSQTYCYGDA